jgi:predicted component of type VI protein secretion system
MMNAQLVVTAGAKPARISLRLPTVIGRGGESQLKVKQHYVSRRHCEIFAEAGQLKIRDLGSSNGTIVNGERIEADFVLSPGDELTLGTVQLCVVFCPQAATSAAAHPAETRRAESVPTTAVSRQAKPRTQETLDEEALDSEAVEQLRLDGSAVLNYQDLDEGSFVAIELDQQPPGPVESAVQLDVAPTALVDDSQIRLDTDNSDAPLVDDDSRLDEFLKGLGDSPNSGESGYQN